MKHLLSYSIFQSLDDFSKEDVGGFLRSIGCDGLELFTLYDDVPTCYLPYSPSVHLPYAVDWYRGWSGNVDAERYSRGDLTYITFGVDREEIVSNICKMIEKAEQVHPAYGVLHAGSTDLEQVFHRHYVSDDRKVLMAFAEMVNTVASNYKGGEPPIRLAFENLWWSGLRLREPWEHKLLEDRLEFDNWCFCLDTGHLMNGLPDAVDESSAIEGALKVMDGYNKDMIDRIMVMHLHYSASAAYRHSFEEREISWDEGFEGIMKSSYEHVGNIDQHRPFTSKRCNELVDRIHPDYVTHEMLSSNGHNLIEDFKKQRSLFD